jgi:hypothetical protein
MLPLVLGGIAMTAVGYGLAKLFEDDCNCSNNKYEQTIKYIEIDKLSVLKQNVYDTSYAEFKKIIKSIKNLNIGEQEDIVIKTNQLIQPNQTLNNIAEDLYNLLYKTNDLFKNNITKVTNILDISDDYNAYSNKAKETLSNTLVLSSLIGDILNLKLENTDNSIKSSEKLITEANKILTKFDT